MLESSIEWTQVGLGVLVIMIILTVLFTIAAASTWWDPSPESDEDDIGTPLLLSGIAAVLGLITLGMIVSTMVVGSTHVNENDEIKTAIGEHYGFKTVIMRETFPEEGLTTMDGYRADGGAAVECQIFNGPETEKESNFMKKVITMSYEVNCVE